MLPPLLLLQGLGLSEMLRWGLCWLLLRLSLGLLRGWPHHCCLLCLHRQHPLLDYCLWRLHYCLLRRRCCLLPCSSLSLSRLLALLHRIQHC